MLVFSFDTPKVYCWIKPSLIVQYSWLLSKNLEWVYTFFILVVAGKSNKTTRSQRLAAESTNTIQWYQEITANRRSYNPKRRHFHQIENRGVAQSWAGNLPLLTLPPYLFFFFPCGLACLKHTRSIFSAPGSSEPQIKVESLDQARRV